MAVKTISIPPLSAKAQARFWKYVGRRGANECWPWTGSRSKEGYGMLGIEGHLYKAHRISWMLVHGQIPAELFICHTCDFPSCCNVEHLYPASSATNNKDAMHKGRNAFGVRSGRTHLTDRKVLTIRALAQQGVTRRVIAARFRITHQSVTAIVLGQSWRHLL